MQFNSIFRLFYLSGESVPLHLLRCNEFAVEYPRPGLSRFIRKASHLQQPRLVNIKARHTTLSNDRSALSQILSKKFLNWELIRLRLEGDEVEPNIGFSGGMEADGELFGFP